MTSHHFAFYQTLPTPYLSPRPKRNTTLAWFGMLGCGLGGVDGGDCGCGCGCDSSDGGGVVKSTKMIKKTPSLNPSKPPPKSLFPLAFISIWAQKNRFNFPNITPGMRQEVILHHNNTTQECRMDTMTAQRFCFSSQKETTSRFYPVHRIGRLNSAFQLLLNTICGSEKLPRLADSRVAIV
jgi:hypothetical protein